MDQAQLKQKITDNTNELFQLLGADPQVSVEIAAADSDQDRSYLEIDVQVDEGAEFIGRYGARMQDISTILNMFLPQDARNYSVLLDINGYREERAEYISELASNNIEQAALTSTEVELEPMLSWERRIVHMKAANRTDVTTESVGEKRERRVKIKPISVV